MSLITESLHYLFDRDLTLLEKEIDLYPDTAYLWKVEGNIINSGANLCLHLCGNLQHFIGAVLGNTGYIRNREQEFLPNQQLSKEELIAEIKKTREAVIPTLATLYDSLLEKDYPVQVLNRTFTTGGFLLHLAGHLNYHLGQINYHRRILVTGKPVTGN